MYDLRGFGLESYSCLMNDPKNLFSGHSFREKPQAKRQTVASIKAKAWHTDFALELGKDDLTLIAGIHAYLRDSIDAGLDENTLRAIYLPLNELLHGDCETETLRCTKLITRLKMQGILLRADFGWGECCRRFCKVLQPDAARDVGLINPADSMVWSILWKGIPP